MKFLIIFFFFSSTSAINFTCQFGSTYYSYVGPKIYRCETTEYAEEENKIVTAISGVHESGKNSCDVQGLWLHLNEKNLDYFPSGFEKFFAHLILIYLSLGEIKNFQGDKLRNYPDLEWFGIHYTPLEFVPGNLFQNNKKLRVVSLHHNKIKQVGFNLLEGLPRLKYVDFEKNNCIDGISEDNKKKFEDLMKNLRENCSVPGEEKTATTTEVPTTTEAIKKNFLESIRNFFG